MITLPSRSQRNVAHIVAVVEVRGELTGVGSEGTISVSVSCAHGTLKLTPGPWLPRNRKAGIRKASLYAVKLITTASGANFAVRGSGDDWNEKQAGVVELSSDARTGNIYAVSKERNAVSNNQTLTDNCASGLRKTRKLRKNLTGINTEGLICIHHESRALAVSSATIFGHHWMSHTTQHGKCNYGYRSKRVEGPHNFNLAN